VAGVPRVGWQDDPGALSNADPALVAEDQAVRRRIQDVESERMVIAVADDPQVALASNDRVAVRLRQAIADGHLAGLRSAHDFLWSEALQRENLAGLRAVPALAERIDRAFSAAGFRPGAFQGFSDELAASAAAPLVPADLAGSPLERALGASLVRLGGRWAAITQLREVRSPEGVRAALAGLDDVRYVDQQQLLRDAYAGYRRTTLRLVALGAAAVLLVLLLRYRRPATALLAFVPSALVALTTLGVLGLLGVGVNVVVAISLVIVMGMGVDYGVFAVDAARAPERVGATLLSLCVSCVTTIFVFGVLALSAQPALRAIGLTTGIGVLLALLAAPAVIVLVRRLG
jgi:predicted exporter